MKQGAVARGSGPDMLYACGRSGGTRARDQTFVKQANFFTTSSWWHYITSSKVSCFSDHFLFFWNLNAMALHACAQTVTPICLKIPSNLLHMELTHT
jgi:hypothetical protein